MTSLQELVYKIIQHQDVFFSKFIKAALPLSRFAAVSAYRVYVGTPAGKTEETNLASTADVGNFFYVLHVFRNCLATTPHDFCQKRKKYSVQNSEAMA